MFRCFWYWMALYLLGWERSAAARRCACICVFNRSTVDILCSNIPSSSCFIMSSSGQGTFITFYPYISQSPYFDNACVIYVATFMYSFDWTNSYQDQEFSLQTPPKTWHLYTVVPLLSKNPIDQSQYSFSGSRSSTL